MHGLDDDERAALLPGPPGEWAADVVLERLVERGLAAWVLERDELGPLQVFEVTALGRYVLVLDALARRPFP